MKIKKYRMLKRLTQKDLAQMLGVHSNTISQWEKQRRRPALQKLIIMAKIFDCTVDDLIE
ncbi:MAG: helix-turn-helix transcriptional regulator [Bacillota bacterium]